MSASLQKKATTNSVALEVARVLFMVLLFAGLVVGTMYCLHVVGDLHTQAETLSACADAGAQHVTYCPTDVVVTDGEVNNVLNQADMFGAIGWVCAIGAFIVFLGIAWALFRRPLLWLGGLLVVLFVAIFGIW